MGLAGQGQVLCRGSRPPALFMLLVVTIIRLGSNHTYAALGPEGFAILQVLFRDAPDRQVISIQPGGLVSTLTQQGLDALIVSEDWSSAVDVQTARDAGIPVVEVKRHISIANIVANIQLLGALTGAEQTANRWIDSIDKGLARIGASVAPYPPTRVLVLSPEAYTQGQGALITELIEMANGINVAAAAGIPEARQIDDQQIRDLSPDVILLIGWTPEAATAFASSPLYRGITAFDRDHVYLITPPGKDPASLVQDVQGLADLMHPVEF